MGIEVVLFPCKKNPGDKMSIPLCQLCECCMKCDTYATMLDEVHDVEKDN